MRYAPYEFKPSDAYDFARHVGILCKERGDELFLRLVRIANQERHVEMSIHFPSISKPDNTSAYVQVVVFPET